MAVIRGFQNTISKYLFTMRTITPKQYYSTNMNTNVSESDFLTINENDGVRSIILNHAKTRNSLSNDMMSFLIKAITNGQDDSALRAIILSANGPIFSAGHNLKELVAETGIEYHKEIFKTASRLMLSIIESPVPVIAKVNGLAAAAGCQLVATCDITICSEKSTFSTPGANFGIFCSTPGIAVGRCVPKTVAMHMLLTGFPLTSKEAYNSGLVSKVVEENELDSEVDKVCSAIKSKSRSVIQIGKEFYYKQMDLGIYDAYKLGADVMVKNVNMSDGQEGICSFAEKRKPQWKS